MQKTTIQNRKRQNLVVAIEQAESQRGLAFVMHGLGGYRDAPHIQTFAKAFYDKGFTVVRVDTPNTFGESDGNYEDATTTNYYEDLEDVIAWAGSQLWYREPFALTGHSLGGICTALYAEKHPEKVLALAPISTVVSGHLSVEAYKRFEPGKLEDWQKTGWQTRMSASRPGVTKKLRWSHMEDRLRYDLLPHANKLTMPVLLLVGERDEATPPGHVKILFDALPGSKEMHVVKDAPHTFRDPGHLQQIEMIFSLWIDSWLR